jgi:hypothetical protein
VVDTPGEGESGIAGYHYTHWRTPVGKVFTSMCDGVTMTVESIITHELAEMIVDPNTRATATMPDGRLIALEICDPVQDQSFLCGATQCSSFVYPSYFDPAATVLLDHLGVLTAPFSTTLGGYRIIDGAWVMAATAAVPKMRCMGRVTKWK